jgi:hypothetical protein
MGNIGTATATKLLNAMLRNTPYTGPETAYLALYTTNPTDDDVGTEVSSSGTGYARVAVTFTDPAGSGGRQCANSAEVEFPEATASWGTISHCGIRTHSAPGEGDTLIAHAALATPKTIEAEDVLRFKAGKLVVIFTASS